MAIKRMLKDVRRRPIAVAAEDYLPPQNGQHLILTIDANIQMIAEQELAAACEQYKAKRGEVVVMDPQTGDVLALANWPTFNPQNLEDSKPETRRDRCADRSVRARLNHQAVHRRPGVGVEHHQPDRNLADPGEKWTRPTAA